MKGKWEIPIIYGFQSGKFTGLDLAYYRKRIPPDQLRVLMDSVGIYPASNTFDPANISYPEE